MTLNPTFIDPSQASKAQRTDSRRSGRMADYDALIDSVIAHAPQVAVLKAEAPNTVRGERLRVAQAITRAKKNRGISGVDSWTGPDGSVYVQYKNGSAEPATPTDTQSEAPADATPTRTRRGS